MAFLDWLPWRRSSASTLTVAPAPVEPFADLPLRRLEANDTVAEARHQHQEAIGLAGSFGGDPDDQFYRRITDGSRMHHRDLTPIQQERAIEVSWFLFEENPLAKRLITLTTDLVIGAGLTVEAEDERLKVPIDRVWTSNVNQLQGRAREFHNALAITGELVLPCGINPITGGLTLGYLDPAQIDAVIPLPDNILIADRIRLKADRLSSAPPRELKIIRENPTTGQLEGEVFYLGINKLPNSLRGRPDLLAFADWIDMFDQFMLSEVERIHLQSAFVWDYEIKGADEKAIKAKLDALPSPRPGTVFGHNENEKIEARTPDLQAQDRSAAGRMMLTHIIGAFGYPLSYFGFTDSNHATIEGQNDVMLRTPQSRQNEYRGFVELVVRFAVEQAIGKNPALYRQASPGFRVRMPEIQPKDIARVGQVLSQVVTAMDTGMNNRTMSRQLAATVTTALLRQLGVDADPAKVLEQADEDAAERQERADDMAADMARTRTGPPNPNAPVPDPNAYDEADDEADDPAA